LTEEIQDATRHQIFEREGEAGFETKEEEKKKKTIDNFILCP
jgi:hypothetical protein